MGTVIWKGDAAPVAQVVTCTIGGTIEATDIFTVTIGSKSVSTVGGSTTAATCATAVVAALNALNTTLYPEFAEITWATTSGGAFTATAKTPGKPFTLTLATTETGGGAADSQTFGQTTTTASTGPAYWDNTANWDTGAIPVDADDIVIQGTSNSILYGLDQSAIQPATLRIDQSFTGTIGNAKVNPAGYIEYRETYLKIGPVAMTIGLGEGAGSGRIKINTGTDPCAVTILNSGQPVDSGFKAIMLKGSNASNSITISKGSVAIADLAGETAQYPTVNVGFVASQNSDVDLRMGSGVTLSGATITKTGGKLEINSNFVTLNQYGGGDTIINGTATATTILCLGGTVVDKSTGTKGTVSVRNGGVVDKGQGLAAATYTNTNVGKGGTLKDPAKKITFTNPIAFTCSLDDCKVDLGNTFNLQRS